MTTSTQISPAKEYLSLDAAEGDLAAMMDRLTALLQPGTLTESEFAELAAIFDNVAYLFLYLESNELHIDYRRLLPWRDQFFRSDDLDARVLRALDGFRCANDEAESARAAYAAAVRSRITSRPGSAESTGQLDDLTLRAKNVLAETERRHQSLTQRLKLDSGAGRAWPAYYTVLSTTSAPTTRSKLADAWQQTRDKGLDELLQIVDDMVTVRQKRSSAAGFASTLEATLTRCRASEGAARDFIHDYITHAVQAHAALEQRIRDTLQTDSGRVEAHFGRYLRLVSPPGTVPSFALTDCLNYIFAVARHTFDLEVTSVSSSNQHVLAYDVSCAGQLAGRINFDLWTSRTRVKTANTTRGIRNRTDHAGVVQHPVAYVSCRFEQSVDGTDLINFQNVHSLFHEFGHAVNHLLIRKRLPNESGLDFLPLERLENLSMWFEKWVYHPAFGEHLALDDEQLRALRVAQLVKQLEYQRTHLERGVTAALDLELHATGGRSFRDTFEALDARYGIGSYCSVGDFPAYFVWPMFQANPGANFAYLWGSAFSSERFSPYLRQRLQSLPGSDQIRESFRACFDVDQPSEKPDSASIFAFYDQPSQESR